MGAKSMARMLKRAKREGREIEVKDSKRSLTCVMVRGYAESGKLLGQYQTRIKDENKWLTPKAAKKKLRGVGAAFIIRENIWETHAA